MSATEKVVNDLNVSKLMLCNQKMLTSEMYVRIGQAINGAIALLKEQPDIVMCKDCVNCIKEPNGELYCDILAVGYEPLGSKKVNGDWFCADGERR